MPKYSTHSGRGEGDNMMFWESFQVTAVAVGQIFILAAIGYILLKKGFFNSQGMDALSRLVMDVTLPILIFCQLIRDFSFQLYPNWWIFPLISVAISLLGLGWRLCFPGQSRADNIKCNFCVYRLFKTPGFFPWPWWRHCSFRIKRTFCLFTCFFFCWVLICSFFLLACIFCLFIRIRNSN